MELGERVQKRTLRDSVARALADSLARCGVTNVHTRAEAIAVDVAESDDRVTVYAAIPGVRAQDIQLTLTESQLILRAVIPPAPEPAGGRWLLHERRVGAVERVVPLAGPVDTAHAAARYADGLLTLTAPRVARTPPRRIPVGPSVTSPAAASHRRMQHADLPFVSHADAPGERDAVTTASDLSFPASDPPSWTPERA